MQRASVFSLLDINVSAFLSLHGIQPELKREGTRVTFVFPATSEVNDLTRRYNENTQVPVLDFVSHLRRLRSQMYSARGD